MEYFITKTLPFTFVTFYGLRLTPLNDFLIPKCESTNENMLHCNDGYIWVSREETGNFHLWWKYSEMKTPRMWLQRYLLPYRSFSTVSFWFMDVKHTLISHSYGEFTWPQSYLPYSVTCNRGFQLNGFNNMHEWVYSFFFVLDRNLLQWFFFRPPPLSAIRKQSMANRLF